MYNYLRFLKLLLIVFLIFNFRNFCLAEDSIKGLPELASSKTAQSTSQTKTYTFAQLQWNTTEPLRSNSATRTFYIPVPKQWKLNGVKLHLLISHSPVMLETSTLTVALNNQPFASLTLTQQNADRMSWDINFPTAPLNQDWLALNFISFLRMDAKPCQDHDNPANWLYIAPESTITFDYNELNLKPDLSQLPYPFLSSRIFESIPSLLVLPEKLTVTRLIPILKTISTFGAFTNQGQLNLDVTTRDQISSTLKNKNNLIFVAKTAEVLSFISPKVLPDSWFEMTEQNVKDPGVIMLINSPWNSKYGVLIVTGNEDTALNKAVAALSQPQFNKLARGKIAIINESPKHIITYTPDLTKTPLTLKRLGYDDQAVLGEGNNTVSYTFNLPNQGQADALQLNTVLSHSVFSSQDHSTLTLVINGVKHASLLLIKANEQQANWKVTIPNAGLRPGKNTLDYIFDLHIPKPYCSSNYSYQIWGVIHANTTLAVNSFSRGNAIFLNQFPAPFDIGSMIILPESLDLNTIKTLTQLFLKLGGLLGSKLQTFNIFAANTVQLKAQPQNNIVLIGTAQNNKWINKALQTAPLKLSDIRKETFLKTAHLSLTDNEEIGLLELMDSPWHNHQKILMITGTSDNAVAWAMNLLIDETKRSQLNGNIAIVDKKGTLTSLNTYYEAELKQAQQWQNKMLDFLHQQYGMLIFAGFALITLLLALTSFYIRYKRKH